MRPCRSRKIMKSGEFSMRVRARLMPERGVRIGAPLTCGSSAKISQTCRSNFGSGCRMILAARIGSPALTLRTSSMPLQADQRAAEWRRVDAGKPFSSSRKSLSMFMPAWTFWPTARSTSGLANRISPLRLQSRKGQGRRSGNVLRSAIGWGEAWRVHPRGTTFQMMRGRL